MKAITVLGAGSWGTALAILLARNGHEVKLWGRDQAELLKIKQVRENQRYLPGVELPSKLTVETDLFTVINNAEIIICAVPSNSLRSVLNLILPYLSKEVHFVLACKGIDPTTGKLMHQVLVDVCSTTYPYAILAGPSFAKEVAAGLPTAITVASEDAEYTNKLMNILSNPVFRPYASHDVVGTEVGGAVKNIIAIAVGVSDGLGYGANARSALITRGLAEIVRLGVALGGQLATFMGLAGIGDLILTSTDNQSRNRRFGLALGQGLSMEAAKQQIGQVVEGATNASNVYKLAKQLQIEMPITEQVYRLLYENITPKSAVNALLSREMKEESF